MQVLLVRRGQPSHEGLSLPLGCLEVNRGAEEGIDWRFNGPEGCSRGRGSLLNPGRGFCLAQPAKSVPWLLLVNRFAVLDIEEVNTDIHEPIDTPSLSPSASDRVAQPQRHREYLLLCLTVSGGSNLYSPRKTLTSSWSTGSGTMWSNSFQVRSLSCQKSTLCL